MGMDQKRFRPLAGISCFRVDDSGKCMYRHGFRPLAGISCFRADQVYPFIFQSFRPLAGISCFRRRTHTASRKW